MRRLSGWGRVLWVAFLLFGGLRMWGQEAVAPVAGPATPSMSLTPAESSLFLKATQAMKAGKSGDALPSLKELLTTRSGDPVMIKLTALAAFGAGDVPYGLSLLRPLEADSPDDPQVAKMLVQAYAGLGDEAGLDREYARLAAMYARGLTPKGELQYLLEKVQLEGKTVMIYHSYAPWGTYRISDNARILDGDGKLLMNVTVESADFDQPQFAKEHPEEAAAGGRRYSVDGYKDGEADANGKRAQTHYTFFLTDKKPAYRNVKAYFLVIALDKIKPTSSRTYAPK